MRLRIDLAYDGTGFRGWAVQPGLRTVQGELEGALATVLRRPVATVCAGRTDTGVHARGQVVHVDVVPDELTAAAGRHDDRYDALSRRLNGVLDPDVRVLAVGAAPDGFDARFSAAWREYRYRVTDAPSDPLVRNHVLAWPRRIDAEAMSQAAATFLGLHDFAAFCKQREGATTIRTLQRLAVAREDGLVVTTVRADAFCHHMVRSLMGCLLAVGDGRRPPEWAADLLAGRRRDPAVVVVPPHGLCLEEVGYADDLAAQAERARNRREGL